MKQCPNCGFDVHDDATGCPDCGGRWAADGSFTLPARSVTRPPETRLSEMTTGELERMVRKTVIDIAAIATLVAVVVIAIAMIVLYYALSSVIQAGYP